MSPKQNALAPHRRRGRGYHTDRHQRDARRPFLVRWERRTGTPTLRHVASLEGGVDGFLARRSRELRKSLLAAADTGVTFESVREASTDTAAALYTRIQQVEAASWKAREGVGISSGPMRAFYEHMLPRLCARGQHRLVFARADDRDIGYILGAVFEGEYRGLQFSYDDEHAALGIGGLLQYHQIVELCAEGIARYDLGTEMDYKRRWAEEIMRPRCWSWCAEPALRDVRVSSGSRTTPSSGRTLRTAHPVILVRCGGALLAGLGGGHDSSPARCAVQARVRGSAHAAALLREILPAALGAVIAWDHIQGETAAFVDAALADSHGDLVFSTRLRPAELGSLYVVLEHQSTADPAMPLRGLSYLIRIWDRFRKDRPGAWLPPVIAVVVSQVPGGWAASRALPDLFDPRVLASPALAALVPRFSLIIEDLAHRTDDVLRGWRLPAFPKVVLWMLRDARAPVQLLHSFDAWIPTMLEVLRAPGGRDAFDALVRYLFQVVDPLYETQLRAKLCQLDLDAEDVTMTIAERLREEGREEGRVEGREEGREEGRVAALRGQLLFKFKLRTLDTTSEACLQTATSEAIDRYLLRALTADSLAAVFED